MIIKNEYIELKPSKFGGDGLFASKNIKKGTHILLEKSVASIAQVIHPDDVVNDYFEKLDIIPNTFPDTLGLLGVIIKNLNDINNKYGSNWTDNLYKFNHDDFIKKLSNDERKYIAQLCIKYQPIDGYAYLCDIYNVIMHNYFMQDNFRDNEYVYSSLYYISSKFNHSCVPNCTRVMFPNYIIITTNQYIHNGTELTIAYSSNILEESGIMCVCGNCNNYISHELKLNKFFNKMISRQINNSYIDINFNTKIELENHISNPKYLELAGIEIWYHFLYDVCYEYIKNKHDIKYKVLILFYLNVSVKNISTKLKIPEKECLMYMLMMFEFLIQNQIYNHGIYEKIKNIDINITYDIERDLENILKIISDPPNHKI